MYQAREFFPTKLDKVPAGGLERIEVGETNTSLERYLRDARAKVWDHEPTSIKFTGSSIWRGKDGKVGFAAVDIDGVTYEAGDCIMVRSTGM
jgi:hypothetical protein